MNTSIFARTLALTITAALTAACGAKGQGDTSTTGTTGTGDTSTGTGGGDTGTGGGDTGTGTGGSGGEGGGTGGTGGTGGAAPATGHLRLVNAMVSAVDPADIYVTIDGGAEMPAFVQGLAVYGHTPYLEHEAGSLSLSASAVGQPIPFSNIKGVTLPAGGFVTAFLWGYDQPVVVTSADVSLDGLAAGKARVLFANFDPSSAKVKLFDGTSTNVYVDHDVVQEDLAPTWSFLVDRDADGVDDLHFKPEHLPSGKLPEDSVTTIFLGSDAQGPFFNVVWADGTSDRIY